ncbi:MAG: hypothetical protein NT120_01845 [Candidatus Aenigmarchaeota archaeon]|nr:hypothetical protein [Candidatus Aenigmarchaeota archaeon]
MKAIDAVGIIVSIIALVGSLGAMYALVQVGAAMTQFTATSAQLGTAVGEGAAQFVQIIQLFTTVCWVWTIAVFLTSIYAIWSVLQKKKK